MKATTKRRSSGQQCELMVNPSLKRKVDAEAASIRGAFPPGLARPALRALHGAGFMNLHQLSKAPEQDVAALHGMGPKALTLLRAGLKANKLRFKR